MAGSAEHGVLAVGGRVLDQAGRAEVGEQRARCGLSFEAGEGCAVAEVDAAAEAEVSGQVGSNRWGSWNRLGSRLPEASTRTTGVPSTIVVPATSMSAGGMRSRMWTGGS